MLSDTSCMVYRRYARYLFRFTVLCTATIYRGISWPWRYWYHRLVIDDKYRGIVGIAQHYCWAICRLARCSTMRLLHSVIFVNENGENEKLKRENRKRLKMKTKKLKTKTKMPKQQNLSLNESASIQYGAYGWYGRTALNPWLTVDGI